MFYFIKQLIVTFVAVIISSQHVALAEPQVNGSSYYIKIEGGTGVRTKKFINYNGTDQYIPANPTNKLVYGAAIGYNFNKFIGFNIGAQAHKCLYSGFEDPDVKAKQSIKTYATLVSLHLNVPTDVVFTPYITGGIGYAYNQVGALSHRSNSYPDANFDADGINTNNFTWYGGGGVRMKAYEHIELDFGYRYANLGKIHTKDATISSGHLLPGNTQQLRFHQILLGLIYNF